MGRWTNIITAVLIAVGVGVYFLVRGGVDAAYMAGAYTDAVDGAAAAEERFTVVATMPIWAERPQRLTLRGRTEANRMVTLRAQTAGVVAEDPAQEGAFVDAGDTACRLAVDAREARVKEAQARVASAELELSGAQSLAERGHRGAQQVAAAEAAFEAAEAALLQARLDLEHIDIRAPFQGVFDQRLAEIGDVLAVGAPCGVVAEIDPILVSLRAAERDIAALSLGQTAMVRLITGETLEGVVRYVAYRADDDTRTFRVEVSAPNSEGAVRAGLTAEVTLAAGVVEAALVPTGVLMLSDEGVLGVRTVNHEDRVRFVPVHVLEDSPEGAWVSGVPRDERVITLGQYFVDDGARVTVTSAVAAGDGAVDPGASVEDGA